MVLFYGFLEITSITTPVITNPKSGNYALGYGHNSHFNQMPVWTNCRLRLTKKMHFVLITPKYVHDDVIFAMSTRTSKFQVHLYLFQQDWSNYIFMFIITALHWSEWFWSTGMIIRLSWYWSRKNFTFYCHCKLWEVECKFFLFLFKVKIHRHRILINHTHPINCDLWG